MVKFGLYDIESENQVPLREVAIESDVMGSVAKTTQVQVYTNNTSIEMEVVYYFPKTMESVFGGLTIIFSDRTVEPEIHERAKAKIIYDEAIREGQTAVLAQLNSSELCG
jgi:Ca-activated chloride channel homolog